MSSTSTANVIATSCPCGPDRSRYRYLREDFGALVVKPLHLEQTLDFYGTRVQVDALGTYQYNAEATAPLTTFELDCNNLEVLSVAFQTGFAPAQMPLNSNDWDAHVARIAATPVVAIGQNDFEVDAANNKLKVKLPEAVAPGAQFALRTVTVARPNAAMLEGLYCDYTPENAPQTIITQCQQYGFQRIVPSVDQMPSKMCYTTTIVADGRYTNLITNGDFAPNSTAKDEQGIYRPYFVKASKPAPADVPADVAAKRVEITYRNWAVPMATYLFFCGVGTYVTYERAVEYPCGQTFQIELLAFPSLVQPAHAVSALQSLHDSIMWTHLSLGPKALELDAERARLYALVAEREAIKAKLAPVFAARLSAVGKDAVGAENPTEKSGAVPEAALGNVAVVTDAAERAALEARLAAVRAEAKELIALWGNETGYKYPVSQKQYREIAMQRSNYGGMENTQNTTIIASRLVPSEHLTDGEYVYMEGVKVHEYYHSLNGSQTTGQSPFEIWLNEAVTVWAQRRREDELFGADFMRLSQVNYAFTPASGPLAVDDSPNSMAVEPAGFNTTHELISAMTYSKAPEFVRMVMLVLGEAVFHRALDYYHNKFAFGNATTADWIACMEEKSGKSLGKMAKGWLKRTGHPTLKYKTKYDAAAQTFTVSLTQTGFENKPEGENEPWVVPVDWALVKDGKNTKTGLFVLEDATATLTIEGVSEKPDFASVARNWSFFGRIVNENGDAAETALQAFTDPDVINRKFAYETIADAEKTRVVRALLAGEAATYTVSEQYVAIHAKMLEDKTMSPSTIQAIVGETEATTVPALAHQYNALADARVALLQAVYRAHSHAVLALFNKLNGPEFRNGHASNGLHERRLKAHCLAILRAGLAYEPVLGTEPFPADAAKVDLFAVASALVLESRYMTDRVMGLELALALPDGAAAAALTPVSAAAVSHCKSVSKALVTPEAKAAFLADAKAKFVAHPDSLQTYIAVVSGLNADTALELIRGLVKEKFYDVEDSGHARGVARGFTMHRKRSLLTKEGLALTCDLCYDIGVVNEMSAYSFLSAFGDINKFDAETKAVLVEALKGLLARFDKEKQRSLYNNITRILDTTAGKQ